MPLFPVFSFRLLQSELFSVEKVTFYCDVRAQLSGLRSSFRPSLPRKQNRRLGSHVSREAALGLSYALAKGKHFTREEFVSMLLTSVKDYGAYNAEHIPTFFTLSPTLQNYRDAFTSVPLGRYLANTVFFAVVTTALMVVVITLSAYAFARMEFRGKNLLFTIVLVQMMLPSQIFITPQYLMLAHMGQTNTIFALVFPGIVSAFGTFFLRQTYLGIPNEIAEAAYLDGCTKWQTFTKVMFPLTGSSCAALAIFTAVFAYSDLMWPLICNTDLNMMTLSAGLSTLNGQYSTNFPVLMAGSLLAMIPMVVLYLLFQKQFIQGIAMTGGK